MSLYRCPYCCDPIREFKTKPAKERYKWFEFTQNRAFCPHCGAEVALEAEFQRWGLLVLPAIVLFVWDVALSEQGGINQHLFYGSVVLAMLGLIMLFLKRKLVVVNPPSNRHPQDDADSPRA